MSEVDLTSEFIVIFSTVFSCLLLFFQSVLICVASYQQLNCGKKSTCLIKYAVCLLVLGLLTFCCEVFSVFIAFYAKIPIDDSFCQASVWWKKHFILFSDICEFAWLFLIFTCGITCVHIFKKKKKKKKTHTHTHTHT